MDKTPKEQEQLYKALFDCNLHILDGKQFIVPFICVSAIPCGLLYKQNLESNPTISDTFTALFGYDETNEIALTLIKFALRIAGCPSEKIDQIQNAGIQETDPHRCNHKIDSHEVKQGLQFHVLLVNIVNALPADLRNQLIHMSSGYLASSPSYTEFLHVHLLRLIQEKAIGRKDVSKLCEMIESIRRQDILDLIDEYCTEFGLPILPRNSLQHPQQLDVVNDFYQASIQESVGGTAIHNVHSTQQGRVEMDNPAGQTQQPKVRGNGKPHWSQSPCRGRKWKCSLIAFLIVLGACCLITFFVFEFHPSISGQVFFEEGDVVMVLNNGFDPFYYTAVNFTRNDSSTQTNDMSNIKLYMQQCSKLVPNQRPILTNVTPIPPTNEDRRHPIYQGYLVRGSKVVFIVNISTCAVLPDCSAALYIFNDYQLYYKFLYSGSHAKSTSKICLCTFNTSNQHLFTSDTSSYYFVALSAPANGVNDIYFQTTGTQMYYSTYNLSPSCNIVRGTNSSCSVPLNTVNQSVQFTTGKKECFLAVLLAESANTGSDDKLHAYLHYSSSTTHNPIHNIATLLTLLVLCAIFVAILVCCIVHCARAYKSRGSHYARFDHRSDNS